ncbi:hypothetical protein LshimejAT787_0901280 [Lyophyllum shimeji]|uniref:Chromo domain-containing protein n=1 Tax=Lyophyllum shimeji TaxID=47721 RepID=A0A9P3UPQ7_LYOSH|nr:hypothetical protein LshimejAT787_0901280 [Lyophyllum shimeji]
MSDDEASTSSAVFQRETQSQFVPQENDEEVLWEVIEITAEKPKFYKVRWAGVDPKTGKPWPQSWVEKRDCTDDLVLEWKRKQALKKKKGNEKKGDRRSSAKSRPSAVSRTSAVSRESTATSSTTTKRSTRQASATTTRVNKNGKRTRADDSDSDAEVAHDATSSLPARKSKKQKLYTPEAKEDSGVDQESVEVQPAGRSKRKVEQPPDEEDEPPKRPSKRVEHTTQTRRPLDSKGRVVEKERIEEDAEEENSRPIPTTQPPAKQPPPKPKPKANYPAVRKKTSPPPSLEPEPVYVKYKSGKVSTPRKKRRISASSASVSSSSDEVEVEVPIRNRSSQPSRSPPAPRTSPATLARLDEFDDELQKIEAAQPTGRPAVQDGKSTAPVTTTKTKRTTAVARAPNGANNLSPDLYRQGVVPETETEWSNNTQSQSQSQPLQAPPEPRAQRQSTEKVTVDISSSPDHPPPMPRTRIPSPTPSPPPVPQRKPARVPTLVDTTTITTPARSSSSLIRKMKPRTPGSGSHFSVVGADEIQVPPDLELPSPELEVVREDEQEEEEERDVAEQEEIEGKDGEEEDGAAGHGGRSRTGSGSTDGTAKVKMKGSLRPLPQLSPSTFMPHLPSTISSVGQGNGAADEEEAEVAEELTSSMEQIEQFSSPEKGTRMRVRGERNERDRKGKGKAKATDSDASSASVTDDDDEGRADEVESVVRARGMQLAARARAERVKEERELFGDPREEGRRRPLTELVDLKEKERQRQEKEKVRRREKQKDRERESEVWALRQEEEESTQDLMMDVGEMRPMEDVNMDGNVERETGAFVEVQVQEPEPQSQSQPLSQPAPPSQPELLPESEKHPAPGPEPEPEPAAADVDEEREGRARSKSKSRSINGRTARQPSPDGDLVLPPTAPPPSFPDVSVEAGAPSYEPDFVATLALLNEKSQENAELIKEIEALKNALAAATSEAPTREKELERELAEARERRDQAVASLAESEKRAEDLELAKVSVEKDREFFREQYAKASGFVTSVREENKELEQQAQIAREQAETGVKMVRATFEARVKTLEDDNKAWRRIALFIAEKDERTNDDIRRRAAEEPELRAQCEELEEDNRVMKEVIDGLQEDLQDRETQVKDLKLEVGRWKKETARLNLELSEVKARLETLDRPADVAPQGTDMVYRCQWRPEGSNEACYGLFSTIEELEGHFRLFLDKWNLWASWTGSLRIPPS